MRWSIRQLFVATLIVVLLLVAYRLMAPTGYDYGPARFIVAVYIAQLTVVTVLAWKPAEKWRAGLVAYALFGAVYGAYLVSERAGPESALRVAGCGVIVGVVCGLTVASISSSRQKLADKE
jgi:hypothetical protein